MLNKLRSYYWRLCDLRRDLPVRWQRFRYKYWHKYWHDSLLRLRLRRYRRRLHVFNWLGSLRWLWVLLAAAASLALLSWIKDDSQFEIVRLLNSLFFPAEAEGAPQRGYTLLLGTVIGAPVLFVLWWFRDSNQRSQIENQRKDINLKDFHQLALWAAAGHLPASTVEQALADPPVSPDLPIQQPSDVARHLPSRRQGAEALQIAAIYQLDAFLAGEYGQHFRRPAFQLLCALWRAVAYDIQQQALHEFEQQLDTLLKEKAEASGRDYDSCWENENPRLVDTLIAACRAPLASPMGQALHVVLWAQNGDRLRAHAQDLPSSFWAGFDNQLGALSGQGALDLEGLDLSGACFTAACLQRAHLQEADLSRADLQGAHLSEAKLQGADLQRAHLQGADLQLARLQGADLQWAHLQGADLQWARLQGADLQWAHLQGAHLSKANLQEANLLKARLPWADLSKADLRGANLWCANLQGANLWCANLQEARLPWADLSKAKLQGAYLQWAHLPVADLSSADLSKADLRGADLQWAHLQWANLQWADLQGADLSEAKLQGADLSEAKLQGANLQWADLQGACLINPQIDTKTDFSDCKVNKKTRVEKRRRPDKVFDLRSTITSYPLDTEATEALLQQMRAQGWPA